VWTFPSTFCAKAKNPVETALNGYPGIKVSGLLWQSVARCDVRTDSLLAGHMCAISITDSQGKRAVFMDVVMVAKDPFVHLAFFIPVDHSNESHDGSGVNVRVHGDSDTSNCAADLRLHV
jgi:hypothetical protein